MQAAFTALKYGLFCWERIISICAADFSLLNLPKGKSLGRSKPATSSYAQALQHTVWDDSYYVYPSSAELPSIEIK